ncbi:peptidase [Mesorhizobium loti]|uniref:Peptidase n=2 Tax=Phyllobacteriaceae TaxID=69277 RepID=A0A6M7TKJ0_9HYPH|nr:MULTISPECIES: caspase family protein [Mesorhizobium]QKC63927.1 peptidase [Mesorhizobium jarvisii]QKD09838.1 peptidase [Mesorhizobium loti]RJT28675.1 peptidase [Mesorhizobium jarvisii]
MISRMLPSGNGGEGMLRKSFSSYLRQGLLLAFLATFSTLWLAQAHAERRAAIVVGNSEYPFAPLTNPRNDAKLIANTLTELKFDVLLFYDVKKSAEKDLNDAIRAHLIGADMAVFYYAGHALQYNGQNLLLPVDTRISSAKDVAADAMRLNDLIDIVKNDPVGVKVFILDACRNNPVAKEKGLQQGLAYTEAGSGQVLVAFATSAGEVAYDGTGINSPYSSALANALLMPNLDVYDTFRTVRGDVRQATAGSQIPWITGSIETKFVFRQGDAGKQVAQAEHAAEANGGLTIDEVLWSFISDSQNPEDFERFVKVFPNSRYAAEATEKSRFKVAALTKRGLYVNGNLVSSSIAAVAPVEASDKALSEEFVFQQAGERAVSETFRIWPSNLPDTQRGMRTMVTDCDLYAADPNDPQRAVPGVTNGLVNVRDALRACAFALAADINNPRLQFQFGRVLEIARRYSWAEHFYELAGNQQYSAALINMGYMARVGMGREIDYGRAFDFYVRAAALGNLRARTDIGSAYIAGQGVPKLPQEGVLWYRLAASSGWANAITALGDAYRLGTGVKQDYVQAASLYSAAADTGQIDAMANLGQAYLAGEGVKKDVPRGLELLQRANDMGNRYAPYFMAQLYLKGDRKLAADPRRALTLLELSANRGNEYAYVRLAWGHRDGLFTGKPDLRRAYFDASLAARLRADQGEQAKAEIAKKIDPATRKEIDGEVELYIKQNGP